LIYIINKSAKLRVSQFSISQVIPFSVIYNVKDVSVIYKKINGSMNHRLWHTSCHTIMIHTWFCDFIGPKYRSQSCDKTRTRIYISAKKKSIDYRWEYWTFTINCFLEHEWYLCPSLLLCTTFICDDYTTCLKIIKLINCITHVTTILGPCKNNAFFFWRTNFKFALFFCVCTCYVAHAS
jgi:hypothetical protein